MRFATNALFTLAATLLCLAPAHAAYPDRPIRLIVPWAPGGSTDVLARLVADKLTVSMGQPVIVENKPGASGNIGSELVAKSKPDGYTLLVGLGNTHVVNPAMYTNMTFKGVEDFTPIAMLGFVTTTMVVNPAVPVSNVAEFIAYAKANPGKLAYASAGVGSSTHLDGAVFAKLGDDAAGMGGFYKDRASYHAARLAELQGNPAEAMRIYREVLDKNPTTSLRDEITNRLALLELK